MPRTSVNVNGARRDVDAPSDTPLLYVLRNDLELTRPQFGCGMAQCGACAVLVDGKATRSCVTPLSQVGAKEVTTLEGLPTRWQKARGAGSGTFIRCSRHGSMNRSQCAGSVRTG